MRFDVESHYRRMKTAHMGIKAPQLKGDKTNPGLPVQPEGFLKERTQCMLRLAVHLKHSCRYCSAKAVEETVSWSTNEHNSFIIYHEYKRSKRQADFHQRVFHQAFNSVRMLHFTH